MPIHSNSTLQKYTTQYPPCTFSAWLPWDHPKFTGCSSEFKNLPFSPGQSWYCSAVGKKHTHSAKKPYNFQKLVTVQNQHLTFALNSHHVLEWSNTFHNTLLIWCLLWEDAVRPFLELAKLLSDDEQLPLCGPIFTWWRPTVEQTEGRGGEVWVGMGWAAVELHYLANLLQSESLRFWVLKLSFEEKGCNSLEARLLVESLSAEFAC